jgi:hypothetical protein
MSASGPARLLCLSIVNMHRVLLFLAVLVAPVLGAEQLRQAEEDDVREVLFKHLIFNAAGAQRGFRVYFLSVGETWTNSSPRTLREDPSDEFMKRFADRTPPVRKVSSCEDRGKDVVEKETSRPGLIFTVRKLKWISKTEIEASGSVYQAGLAAHWATYTLMKVGGKWKITGVKNSGVS